MGGRDQAHVERRFDTVVTAARRNRTAVSVERISELLPTDGPEGRGELLEWLAARPELGSIIGDRVIAGPIPAEEESAARLERGRRYLEEAEHVVREPLAPIRSLLRCVAVTGSAAYGEPSPHDDLDFLIVTRRGAVWPVLLYTYLAARLRRKSGVDGPSHWCFNYVLDEREARREFAAARGFLFAREALTARPVAGAAYYRGLVREAHWLAEEVPRLYETWRAGGLPELPTEEPAPRTIRVLNSALYPIVAGYLTAIAMVRNRRYRRNGEAHRCFRVEAGLTRLTFESERFEELRSLYESASRRATPEAT